MRADLVLGRLLDHAVEHAARVVHHDVELADQRNGLLDGLEYGPAIRHVHAERKQPIRMCDSGFP